MFYTTIAWNFNLDFWEGIIKNKYLALNLILS